MQTDETEAGEGANDEERAEGAGNDEGPLALLDGGDIVHDTVEGRQDSRRRPRL
jgi:hypothetical protein